MTQKTSEDFRAYCRNDLRHALGSINKDATGTDTAEFMVLIFFVVAGLILGVAWIFYVGLDNKLEMYGLAAAGTMYWALYKYVSSLITRPFDDRYEALVTEKILAFVDPSFHMDPDHSIEEEMFLESGLFHEDYTWHFGDNHISGSFDGVQVEMQDFDVSRFDRELDKTECVFSGLFVVAELEKPTRYEVNLIPDTHEIKMPGFPHCTRVVINSVEFENVFNVYGTDDVKTAALFTPELVGLLLDHWQTTRHLTLFSLKGNRLFIAVDRPYIFHNKLEMLMPDEDELVTHFEDFQFIRDLVALVGAERTISGSPVITRISGHKPAP